VKDVVLQKICANYHNNTVIYSAEKTILLLKKDFFIENICKLKQSQKNCTFIKINFIDFG